MDKMTLPQFSFKGTAKQVGHAHGEALRDMIQGFIRSRKAAARLYFSQNNGSGKSISGLTEISAHCLKIFQEWDEIGYEEHMAIAEGANCDPVELFQATGYTDLRDAYLLAGDKPDAEGCTALMLPKSATADGKIIGAQSWDLNPADIDYVVAIHTKTEGQPEKWSVSTAGSLSLMGMNANGIAVGTTNIKTYGSKEGVSYINLLHRALRLNDQQAILKMLADAPRIGAHTYWVVNEEGGMEFEMSPERHTAYSLDQKPRTWTNHCLADEHVSIEYEPASSSSLKRLDRMTELLDKGSITVEDIQAAFADRSDGVDSINRYPEDEQGTATNACMITIPEDKTLWACKGPADRGLWVKLGFDS